jgi:hypothetical protein
MKTGNVWDHSLARLPTADSVPLSSALGLFLSRYPIYVERRGYLGPFLEDIRFTLPRMNWVFWLFLWRYPIYVVRRGYLGSFLEDIRFILPCMNWLFWLFLWRYPSTSYGGRILAFSLKISDFLYLVWSAYERSYPDDEKDEASCILLA